MAGIGAAVWLLPASLATAACMAFGLVQVELVVDPTMLLPLVVTQAVLLLLLEALPEEVVFRGYLFVNLAEWLGGWSTILAQAGLFTLWGLLIGAIDTPWRLATFFAVGFGFGYLRAITGSIWPGVGFHIAFQTVAQLLDGTQVQVAAVTNLAVLEVLAHPGRVRGLRTPTMWHSHRSRGRHRAGGSADRSMREQRKLHRTAPSLPTHGHCRCDQGARDSLHLARCRHPGQRRTVHRSLSKGRRGCTTLILPDLAASATQRQDVARGQCFSISSSTTPPAPGTAEPRPWRRSATGELPRVVARM